MQDSHSITTGTGKRKYTFEAKKTDDDKYFMKIIMDEYDYGQKQLQTITVYEDDMDEFKKGLKEMFGFLSFKKKED